MKLSEFYDISTNEGIFTELGKLFDWMSDDAEYLNYDYYLNNSGDKEVSPLFNKLYEKDSTGYNATLATILKVKFGDNWNRLYEVFIESEYNPIDNYSMTEEGTDTNTNTRTDNLTHGTTNTRTNDLTKSESLTTSGTDETKVQSDFTTSQSSESGVQTYGFNSTSPVNQNDTSGTVTSATKGSADDNKTTTTKNGQNTDTITDTGTVTDKGTATDTGTVKDDGTITHKLTRSGNIGVTTSQRMITAELELREWNLIKHIYNDIDSVLTLQYFGGR